MATPTASASSCAYAAAALLGVYIVQSQKSFLAKSSSAAVKSGSLINTVAPLDKHVIVCGMGAAESWPGRLEEDRSSVLSRLAKVVADMQQKREERKLSIKITGSDEPNTMAGYTDVIVMPEQRMYRLNDENITPFAQLLLMTDHKGNPPAPVPATTKFHDVDYPYKLLLVCSHTQRDKRCGKAGPLIIAKAKEILNGKEADFKVHASSHIGGHEYAGTTISYPQANWHGHITPKVVGEVIEAMNAGTCVERCFRGNSMQW